MIVCSCNIVSDTAIETAITEMLEICSDIKKVTSGGVLKILGKKYDCFGCQPAFEKVVQEIETKIRQKIPQPNEERIIFAEAAE